MSFPLIQIDERKIVLLSGFRSEPGNCVIVTAKSELEAAARRCGGVRVCRRTLDASRLIEGDPS